jgi:hypothetical protein
MSIDHVNVKVFAQGPIAIDLGDAIPVFHRWIQEAVLDELLIDVADYRHVPAGPGVMLIGHEANYSLDCAFDELGLLYNRKRAFEGSIQDKLLKSFGCALSAASRLENEHVFKDKLKFNAGQVEVIVNDRLLAPNTDETWAALKPDFEKFFGGLFGSEGFTLQHEGEARERFRVRIRTAEPMKVDSWTSLAAVTTD